MTARWARPADEHHTSKLDAAIDRGFDPGERPHPTPAHLSPPAGVNPLAWFINATRALRIVGPLTRCAHPHCRTSVTEDDVSFCPHNLPFCEACDWLNGCPECASTHDKKASR